MSPHGKTHCLSMQPPASERHSAACKAQSLGSSLIHTIPAPHQWLPCVEDTLSFTDISPTSAAAVCRGYPLIHMIPAPHQWLPCVEDSALSLIQGDMGPLRCKESPHPPAQKNVQRRGVFDAPAREGEE